MGENVPWEKSYPPGVRWDVPIETAPLPSMFDAFTAQVGPEAGARIPRPHRSATRSCARPSMPSPPA